MNDLAADFLAVFSDFFRSVRHALDILSMVLTLGGLLVSPFNITISIWSMTFGILFISFLQAVLGGWDISEQLLMGIFIDWVMFVIGAWLLYQGNLIVKLISGWFYLWLFMIRFGHLW